MQIQYNTAGEMQGISCKNTDSNFTQAIAQAMEIVNEHPFYFTSELKENRGFIIGKLIGDDSVVLRTKQITEIEITEERIFFQGEKFCLAIFFHKPQFIIH